MEKKPKIIFTEGSVPFILEAIGYKVGSLDQVLDEYDNPALDIDGQPFFTNQLIGIIDKKFITRESQIYALPYLLNK